MSLELLLRFGTVVQIYIRLKHSVQVTYKSLTIYVIFSGGCMFSTFRLFIEERLILLPRASALVDISCRLSFPFVTDNRRRIPTVEHGSEQHVRRAVFGITRGDD